MEGIEEGKGSDNEAMAIKTVKKGKRVLKKNRTSLLQLEKKQGVSFIELGVLRLLE